MELYTDQKDLAAERKLEDALDGCGIFYEKSETWIDSEKLYEVLYVFAMSAGGEDAGRHYALITVDEDGDVTFGTPVAFEFDGDVKKIRHVLYNCSAARPNIESATNEEEIEVQTEKLAITATPLANGYVKARTGDSTTDTVYTGWYTSVYMPTVTDPEISGVQQSSLREMEEDEIGGETL